MSRPLLSRPCGIKLDAAADERELYRYVMQSFRAFEQAIFAEACEKSATAGGGACPEDAGPREEGDSSCSSSSGCRYSDGPLLSEVSGAMAAGLQDYTIAYERLEEVVDR